jgi:Tol biopolymer transport system component
MKCRPAHLLPALLALAFPSCGGDGTTDTGTGPEPVLVRTVAPSLDAELMFTAASGPQPSLFSPRDVFTADESGSGVLQNTFCAAAGECDFTDVAPSGAAARVMTRRLRGGGSPEIVFVDLARGVEAVVVTTPLRPTGVDWTPGGELLVYSAGNAGGPGDLFRAAQDGTGATSLTASPEVEDHRPRLDAGARAVVYERRATASDRTVAVLFANQQQQFTLTQGAAGPALPDGSYRVGSDADPTFSPDGRFAVLRRLRAVGTDGRGEWDLVVVSTTDGSVAERVLVTGPAFRGAPDWGPLGIVFPESDPGSTTTRLVVVQPDGSGRRVPVTLPGRISSPRWIGAAAR